MGAKDPLDTEVRYVAADGEAVTTSLRLLDLERASTALPVRRLRSHARQRHYCGRFWSATTGGHVPYESRLELDRLWLADFDPDVRWIAAQPMWFAGPDDGTTRRHAPDLLLTDQRGSMTVVDVKPAQFVKRSQVQAVFRWTARLCQAKGVGYQVWSGADPVALANIRGFAVARRGIQPSELAAAAAAARTGMKVGQVEDLLAACGHPRGRLAVLGLLWRGDWTVDMTKPVDGTATISIRGGG
ncbi:MAG: TnsA-like heteromeric transposase endonuclease subunit [Ornithinimicrobium sp.]|uniref:TnsA-like heteromeric transposase endonuclease subunit n=1 Tax=Ornithinimicrobium sp. TaxID=1977084 RepID=UPI0026E0BEDC|nr:TnsA-like heteromeric transposase endonuclease subunit [Ornithinimicrobium sp.]MDO5740614.1 TnsA-like heteromeric transposase endonuclease subunit [Ornithinimicrobium sp.]